MHRRIAVAISLFVVLAACAAPRGGVLPTAIPSRVAPNVEARATGELLYASALSGCPAPIHVFKGATGNELPNAIMTACAAPNGLAVGPDRNLYVLQGSPQNAISAYSPPGYGERSIADAATPQALTIAGAASGATVYVANAASETITEYAVGTLKQTYQISFVAPVYSTATSLAVDSRNYLYVAADPFVEVWQPGYPNPSWELTIANFISPAGILVGKKQLVYVSTNSNSIQEYQLLPKNNARLVRTISHIPSVTRMALDRNDNLYVAFAQPHNGHALEVYAADTTRLKASIHADVVSRKQYAAINFALGATGDIFLNFTDGNLARYASLGASTTLRRTWGTGANYIFATALAVGD